MALDDDIVMLTADELEFAYEVWNCINCFSGQAMYIAFIQQYINFRLIHQEMCWSYDIEIFISITHIDKLFPALLVLIVQYLIRNLLQEDSFTVTVYVKHAMILLFFMKYI